MVTQRGFLFVGFFFCSSSGTLRSKTTNVMAICAQEQPLHNLVIIPETYASDCDSTHCGRHNLSCVAAWRWRHMKINGHW